VKRAKADWDEVYLICAKCQKKLKGCGFGADGRQSLGKALRSAGGGKGRKAGFGVVETKCLKLCPKGAVTVVRGSQPARWLVVPPGTPVDEVLHDAPAEAPQASAVLVH